MSSKHRVLWSEGMLLLPQHFQQQDRYFEGLVEGRARALRPYSWGFTELVIDRDQLRIGKIVITRAKGVFPDGTPFDMPDVDPVPAALDVDPDTRDQRIHLAVPISKEGEPEYASDAQAEGLARFSGHEVSVRDSADYSRSGVDVRVGQLRSRVMLEHEQREDYACLGLGWVLEVRADRSVLLSDEYIPPMLDVSGQPKLDGFVKELKGMLHQRGDALAGHVSTSGQGGAAEVSEFLLLQAVNRYEPVIGHLMNLPGVHPADLYTYLLEVAGDLATFNPARRAPEFPAYRHDDLAATFQPVLTSLRESLGKTIERRAVQIPLKEPRFGIRAGLLADRTLLDSADFVLAVRADMPSDDLRGQFPPQAKIGAVETIKRLIESGVPGIRVNALAVAPRQIPYHADYVYFQLDRNGDHWADMQNSGGFAIYVASELPGMDMQFWAIRR
ncbi:MAG: type VI secretion system baseplate subunit TssK [Pseudomonadota bacterium]